MQTPQARMLPDGRRLHLNHGPIDLIVGLEGAEDAVAAGLGRAQARFSTILEELVAELPELRRPATASPRRFRSPVAQRMELAVAPLAQVFLTPMAAVAGAVADAILAAIGPTPEIVKAYVNNGGDVAFRLAAGHRLDAAIAGTGHGLGARVSVRAEDGLGGIATSGWRGRSHSLGIADAVTVLAATAAEADAAATIVANAVDLPGHPRVERVPARSLSPDSDLGERLVTCRVGALSAEEADAALAAGAAAAERLRARGLVAAVGLFVAGRRRLCGAIRLEPGASDTPSLRKEPALA